MSNPFEKGPGLPPSPEQPEDDSMSLEEFEEYIHHYEPAIKKFDSLVNEEGTKKFLPQEDWMSDDPESLPDQWNGILAAAKEGDFSEERHRAISTFSKYYERLYQLQQVNPELAKKCEQLSDHVDEFLKETYGLETVRPLDDDGSFDRNRDLTIIRIAADEKEFPGDFKILRPGLYDEERKVLTMRPVVIAKPRYR